jgi:hypothetical protein
MTTKVTKNSRETRKVWGAKPFGSGLALAAVLVATLVFAAVAFAGGGGLALDWQVLASGGGSSSSSIARDNNLSGGGGVTLDSTLGQPITGVSTGGDAWLGAGYWYAEQPVQLFLPLLRR